MPILCHPISINRHPWYAVAHKNIVLLFVAFSEACRECYTALFQCAHYFMISSAVSLVFYFLCILWSSKNIWQLQPECLHCASAKTDFTYFNQRLVYRLALYSNLHELKLITLFYFHWSKWQHSEGLIFSEICWKLFVVCFSGLLVML